MKVPYRKNSNPRKLNLKDIWRVYRIYTSVSPDVSSNTFSRLTPFHIREILSIFYTQPIKSEVEVIQKFTQAFEVNHFPDFYKAIKGIIHVKS